MMTGLGYPLDPIAPAPLRWGTSRIGGCHPARRVRVSRAEQHARATRIKLEPIPEELAVGATHMMAILRHEATSANPQPNFSTPKPTTATEDASE